jgi:hypothetical protein
MQKANSATPVLNQQFYPNAPTFVPSQAMPQIKVDVGQQAAFQRQPTFNQKSVTQNPFQQDFSSTLA